MTVVQTEMWQDTTLSDPVSFRRALGAFATGVTVVAAQSREGQVRAFTANSFTSVSLDPPLVLVCLGKTSGSFDVFTAAETFSISILDASQREASSAFASRDPVAKMAALEQLVLDDAPYVANSLATFSCARHQIIDAGDHVILIGLVRKFLVNEGQPLAFYRGGYVGVGAELREIEQLRASIIVGGVLGQQGRVLLIRKPGTDRWVIPTVSLASGSRHDEALQQLFERLGIEIGTAVPYSLFQERSEVDTTLIFSVESATQVQDGKLEDGTELAFFDSADAELNRVGGTMKPGVLQRYLAEMSSGLFGVYFDSMDGGSVVPIHGKPVSWDSWYRPAGESAPQASSMKD
jgi:flavin reductase (DIM6/NTAB) family NADH-FMN oxidoreductase RutF